MTQSEKGLYLIRELQQESMQYEKLSVPYPIAEQKQMLRALLNVRMPKPARSEFLEIQDNYLQEEIRQKGITNPSDLSPIQQGIYLWQGDITTLACDAIVNAANSQLLGCFCPCHSCIDNVIHTFAGVQLRLACAELMSRQGHEEETGNAKITPAFNLPCKYVLHTVGPIIMGKVKLKDKEQLASCYRSCLALADENNVKSIAFCCISTGEFHFPNKLAANIAIQTVKSYKAQTQSKIEVIFNVFKENDYNIYKKLLGAN